MVIRALDERPNDVALGRLLVREYVDATFAESEAYGEPVPRGAADQLFPELVDFAAVYARPSSVYLVAEIAGGVAGGVGLLPLDSRTCEMKRLWVRAPHRGAGVARALCVALVDHARALGYQRMALDVVPQRTAAIALYRSLGFTDAPPSHDYPFSMTFLARDL